MCTRVSINNLHLSTEDHICFFWDAVYSVIYSVCCIPPIASQYSSNEYFLSIQESLITSSSCDEYFILGIYEVYTDRTHGKYFNKSDCHSYVYSYSLSSDDHVPENGNALIFGSNCSHSKLLWLNSLEVSDQHFRDRKT